MDAEALIDEVTSAAAEVYDKLGAGYIEPVYEEAMAVEFRARKLPYEIERTTEIFYKDVKVGTHKLDFIVAGDLVVELKAGASISKGHIAQLRSYMKTLGIEHGIVINFPYPEQDEPATRTETL